MRYLAKYFLRGLLVIVPAAATLWILYRVFRFVDGLIRLPMEDWTVPVLGWEVQGIGVDSPTGLGFVLTLVLITVIGFLASSYLTRSFFQLGDRILTTTPVVKLLYGAIKDVIRAFLSEEKKFDKPVLVSLGEGLEARVIGFITQEDTSDFGLEETVAVYVPQSYNFAANLLFVPRRNVQPLEGAASEIMTFVVSGGVSSAGSGTGSGSSRRTPPAAP